ncbi:hypothetical protein [Tumebacillus flagellatus]|uniref:hypothetical protein n=1 Tax=Tumebacillus flagellatus TaxID=1157490 RepID=UPI001377D418|nr:hypothetical protein [Tumebacillus flagellatus]
MIETLIRLEPEQYRFLQLYKVTHGLAMTETIRTLIDDMMASESALCEQFADLIFKGE